MIQAPKITVQKGNQEAAGDGRAVYSVPEAGKILGLGRNAAYEAAARGDIPVIRIGKLLKVPKVALQRMLTDVAAARPRKASA